MRLIVQMRGLKVVAPEQHRGWTDDDYAGRVVVHLARGAARELEPGEEGTPQNAGIDAEAERGELVEAMLLCLEWAFRNHWVYDEIFALGAHRQERGLIFTVLRATEAVASAHWAVQHNNSVVGRERLAFALGHILDYCQDQGWQMPELLLAALAKNERA